MDRLKEQQDIYKEQIDEIAKKEQLAKTLKTENDGLKSTNNYLEE
jgi:hypothetical protein